MEQYSKPIDTIRVEPTGQEAIDFDKLEMLEKQKEQINKLKSEYPNSKVDFSSITPDGKGNFILEGIQLMTYDELKSHVIEMVPGNDEALKKERLEVAHKYHIANPDEMVKMEDGSWYFHDMPVEKYDAMMSDKPEYWYDK